MNEHMYIYGKNMFWKQNIVNNILYIDIIYIVKAYKNIKYITCSIYKDYSYF